MKRPSKAPVVLLTTSVTLFLFAITQLKEAIRAYLVKDSEYRFNMTLFIIFLVFSFFFVGIYFGIWWNNKSKGATPPQKQKLQKA